MKSKFSSGLYLLLLAGSASAQGLYYTGSEKQEPIPLKWVVGTNLTYDDNIAPGVGDEESSVSLNPYVGLTVASDTPQTTWDIYGRLGVIYYLDEPSVAGASDLNSQSRAGFNIAHRVNERLRISSRNFVSYELEPDYAYGFASTRQLGESLYWQSDNALGYRWTERLGTFSGLRLTGTSYEDVENNDRFSWELYNQLRYQVGPQTIVTGDYRYAETSGNGVSTDATDHYVLAGVEHRFNPNTIGVIRAGAQFHDVDASGGESQTSPYFELALNSQVNQQFSIKSFTRYGIENYDTVQTHPVAGLVEFADRRTLRIGLSADYIISPTLSLFGGVDYIPTSYNEGRAIDPKYKGAVKDLDEDLVNAYVGVSVKFNDFLTGTASYNYTDSSSDLGGRNYDRNRINLGLSAEF